MNLLRISSAFDIINESQAQIDYAFEPRILSPQTKNYKRNVYYKECKVDFIEDVSLFGFCPFIMKSYQDQKNDIAITKFKHSYFHNGLLTYIKKKNTNKQNIKKNVLTKLANITQKGNLLSNLNTEENKKKQYKEKMILLRSESSMTKTKRNSIRKSDCVPKESLMLLKMNESPSHGKKRKKENNVSLKEQIVKKFFSKRVTSPDIGVKHLDILLREKKRKEQKRRMLLNAENCPTSIFKKARVIGRVNLSF